MGAGPSEGQLHRGKIFGVGEPPWGDLPCRSDLRRLALASHLVSLRIEGIRHLESDLSTGHNRVREGPPPATGLPALKATHVILPSVMFFEVSFVAVPLTVQKFPSNPWLATVTGNGVDR